MSLKKKKKKTTGFYIDEELLVALTKLAEQRRMSVSAIVCQLIEKEIKNDK